MTNKAFVVIRAFQDKDTLKHFEVGDTYTSSDDERVSLLQEKGFLGKEEPAVNMVKSDDDERLKHVGGGTYELPNGERIKGKDKAEEALKALDEDTQGAGDNGPTQ